MGLITEALRLRRKVLGLVGWNATLMDVDGHSFFKGLDVWNSPLKVAHPLGYVYPY